MRIRLSARAQCALACFALTTAALMLGSPANATAQEPGSGGVEIRIGAQRLADGRTEVALQVRSAMAGVRRCYRGPASSRWAPGSTAGYTAPS